MMPRMRRGWIAITLLTPGAAFAVPGPDSTAIVANANVRESVELAERYRKARAIPERHLCALALPTGSTIDFATYESAFFEPLESCLSDAGVLDRIEALVLAKGLPLRVAIPTGDRNRRASLAAVASVWKTEDRSGRRLAGTAPGIEADCGGTPCYAAFYPNPFTQGLFEAGWARSQSGQIWRPLLVTALEGRSYADAARLVASATTAEARGGAPGDFVFMEARDGARGRLDVEFDAVVEALDDRGFSARIVPFQEDLREKTLASFFVGTARLGDTIEGNTYLAGALVDNLTSFGAVPENFAPEGERQVSVARWVAQGVAGVHGTTDEPLNNCFPSRRLILDYVDGGTLGEAYFRRMPFAYWRNLVLGDPMAAPYAVRPAVRIDGVDRGETVDGAREITVRAIDPLGRGIESIAVFVDGVEIATAGPGDTLSACLVPPAGDDVQLLAVAQVADDGSPAGFHQPKGWAVRRFTGVPGATRCASPDAGVPDAAPEVGPMDGTPGDRGADGAAPSDAGVADATGARPDGGADAGGSPSGSTESDEGGCRCTQRPTASAGSLLVFGLLTAAAIRRPCARRLARTGSRRSPNRTR